MGLLPTSSEFLKNLIVDPKGAWGLMQGGFDSTDPNWMQENQPEIGISAGEQVNYNHRGIIRRLTDNSAVALNRPHYPLDGTR